MAPRRVTEIAWFVPVRFAWIQALFTAAVLFAAWLASHAETATPLSVAALWTVVLAVVAAVLGWVYVALATALHFVCVRLGIVCDGAGRSSPPPE